MGVLTGRVALVTGAGQGVGRGIARALAAEGARLAIVGRTTQKVEDVAAEIRNEGGDAHAFTCDILNPEQIEQLIAGVVDHFGSLSILVNNAQSTVHGELLDLPEEDYFRGMESGPLATWRLMRASHPHLRGHGSIVNLGSAAGVRWNPTGYGGYAAAKEAIRVLTRTAACEWASHGIRVNAILPLANSPALDDWSKINPEESAEYMTTIPLGRLGDSETDIGPAVVFLCSESSRYITGHSLPVDGGQVLMR
ncbi:3-oxoacyl-ACP reductase [Arthrobacter sp. AQ5-05]|uniref:SDR family NAD(P)-dependent oxidoreductase n=1 Tax=Arthrobacter sp. AQ5-05 TaxID=2184581 RepID=UPI000DCDF043|nr:SDR family NAD(P)-dependent oxidoreductase [Arthrobacter sp. AQ5-05]RAX48049.1 3-oxoacyl-ACP reductase [Arthrobacter sp. AQ5-05]